MKKIILGTFDSRPGAHILIQHLRRDLNVPQEDISCICKDAEGQVYEVTGEEGYEREELSRAVKAGSLIGGTLGMVGGVAMLFGLIPVLGPIFEANIFVTIIGMGASALGSLAIGALVGAIIGGLVAALFEEEEEGKTERANRHDDVLVVAHARNEHQVGKAFTLYGASGVEIYTPTL